MMTTGEVKVTTTRSYSTSKGTTRGRGGRCVRGHWVYKLMLPAAQLLLFETKCNKSKSKLIPGELRRKIDHASK